MASCGQISGESLPAHASALFKQVAVINIEVALVAAFFAFVHIIEGQFACLGQRDVQRQS